MLLTHYLVVLLPLATFFLIVPVLSNPAAYGICQSRCANNLMACYAAAGSSFGAITTEADVIPEQMVCNADYSNCQVDCIDTFIGWVKGELKDSKERKKNGNGPTRTSNCGLVVQE